MPRTAARRVPLWKQAVAVACLLYALLAWVVPTFMLPFVNILPFVQEKKFLERLPFSVLGSAAVAATLTVMNGGKIPGSPTDSNTREKLRYWFGIIVGLAMFTTMGAALSANSFGLVTKVLPYEPFEVKASIDGVEHSGSRYKSVELRYRDASTGANRYLVLSKRLFDYPKLQPGDVVEFRGRKTAIGVYVEAIDLQR